MRAAIYNIATGEITSIATGPVEFIEIQPITGEAYLEVAESVDDLNSYILSEGALPKPTQDTTLSKLTLQADGIDTVVITDAPVNSTLSLQNLTTGETLSATFSTTEEIFSMSVGKLELTIKCFPYLDFIATLEAL